MTAWKVEGLRELEDALMALPRATARNVCRRALKKAAEPIAEKARAKAPVDESDLRDSIAVSERAVRNQKQSAIEMHVGPGRHPQGVLQEFGTYKEPAQPFMRPAWEAEKHQAMDTIVKELGVELDKATVRAQRKAARLAGRG